MKQLFSFNRSLVLILILFSLAKIASGQFAYVNPLPGSKYHNPQTTIAIKNGALIDVSSVAKKDWIEINGSKSGTHTWSARLSDDKKTIIVKPRPVFDYGETVTVTIDSKLKKEGGKKIDGKTFSFQISDAPTAAQEELRKQAYRDTHKGEFNFGSQQSEVRGPDLDSLPTYTISVNNNAAPGELFYNNQYDFDPNNTNCFNTIIENDGTVVYAQDMGTGGHDFKINYNGYLTYFEYLTNHWIVMDSDYHVIDSIMPGNGYDNINPHDISIYSNGHALILIDDYETVDMTQYGGQPNAQVNSVIIQEIDANGDVVWEWSGWDHFQLSDADSHVVLTSALVDAVHSNAVSLDNDGNVLLSSRFLSEVTKINHETGDIIWRLGGENNQFTFVNDNIPQHFSYQHDARKIANGNLTLYNNANYLQPQRSSAKEYHLDEVNHTATLVWYYEHPDVGGNTVNGPATGSVQRLPDGHTLISWGTNTVHQDRPAMTEVDSNKNITWEMKFDQYGQKAYRVHKYVWNPCAPVNAANVQVKKITTTSAKVVWNAVKDATSYDLQYRKLGKVDWKLKNTTKTSKQIINLTAGKTYQYQLRTHCSNNYASDWTPIATFTTLPLKLLSDENIDASEIAISPNPASDILNMAITLDHDQQISVFIYNVEGKLMFTNTQALLAGAQEMKMDIAALPAGYYLARVNDGSTNQTLKFVKE